MKITVLMENTTSNPALYFEHGLALYIETAKHKIHFDAGASKYFAHNARTLGIDLSQVDTFVLSHGHNDHGGGLPHFLTINKHAKIYVQQQALDQHFSKRNDTYVDIGVSLPEPSRVIFVNKDLVIDEELHIFSQVPEKRFYPHSNRNLFIYRAGTYPQDDFAHEQNLLITEKERHYLVAGCAHKGMLNIINAACQFSKGQIDVAIGGLHLYSHSSGISEAENIIQDIGYALLKTKVRLLTCHCTGEKAFKILKPIMQDKITYLRTGLCFEL